MEPKHSRIIAMACLALAACQINPFRIGDELGAADSDAGAADAAMLDDGAPPRADAGPPDAHIFDDGGVCTPSPEVCDGSDNDCDGEVDEDFDTTSDPNHCGGCNLACDRENSVGECVDSECEFECLPGFHDLDPAAEGCEYFCIETNGGVEVCDFADNDCNGAIDETVDTQTDLNNCGGCGKLCDVLNADPVCSGGECTFGACEAGFGDISDEVFGCEYQCPVSPPLIGMEECNGQDDDCDGLVDEGPIIDIAVGADCFREDENGNPIDDGICGENPGTTQCVFGVAACIGAQTPQAEQCDGLDNDCDGTVDNGFNFQNDVNNCGGCGNTCAAANAISLCTGGDCTFVCKTGFHDLVEDEGDPSSLGCEYECDFAGVEVCDGVDNDCDGLIDTDDDLPVAEGGLLIPPDFCNNFGACERNEAVGELGHELRCSDAPCEPGVVTWRCHYPDADTTCGGFVLANQESACDDEDNDCDFAVDETHGTKFDSCVDNGVGECQGSGQLLCNAAGSGVECVIDTPGTGDPDGADPCDNKDNNCNGLVDEDPDALTPGAMVNIAGSGSVAAFSIYAFEASRPGASLTSEGSASAQHRACSVPDTLPWRQVTQLEAAQACADAGLRLCTADEWKLACGGIAGGACTSDAQCGAGEYCHVAAGVCSSMFPYGGSYEPLACNGDEYDVDLHPVTCKLQSNDNDILPTGSVYGCPADPGSETQCLSSSGAVDMSGNVKEWTATAPDGGGTSRLVLGGAYDNADEGLTCNFDFLAIDREFALPTIGFRCCGPPIP